MPAFPRELAVMAGSASCSRAGATFTRTITSAMPNSQLASQNWEDFNYPPLLHLWHYAPDELEQGPRFVARTRTPTETLKEISSYLAGTPPTTPEAWII